MLIVSELHFPMHLMIIGLFGDLIVYFVMLIVCCG